MLPSGSNFQDLARQVASEQSPEDSGLCISSETQDAYTQMLQCYDAAVALLYGMDRRGRLEEVRHYIEDVPRTIIMIRAMARAICERAAASGAIRVVEAGCGTGFLSSVAAALEPRVRVMAFDHHQIKRDAALSFAEYLGFQDRVQVQVRDLLSNPFCGETDVLISEHLSLGLQAEPATAITRSFSHVDKNFVIPYGVVPVVVFGWDLHVRRDSNGCVSHTFVPSSDEDIRLCKSSREIVLGDPSCPAEFAVQGSAWIHPGCTPFLVRNDIRWGSPHLGDAPLFQVMNDSFLKQFFTRPEWENHLMGFSLLNAHVDPETVSNIDSPFEYLGIENPTDDMIQARFEVRYPIGIATAAFAFGQPDVRVFSSDLKVLQGSSSFFARRIMDEREEAA